MYALATASAPQFLFIREESSADIEATQPRMFSPHLTNLPTGFATIITLSSSNFGPEIVELIQELANMYVPPPAESHPSAFRKTLSPPQQIQCTLVEDLISTIIAAKNPPHISPFGDLQRPLSLALSIYIWHLRPQPAGMSIQAVIASTLLDSIKATSIALNREAQKINWPDVSHANLLLWIVFVGLTCAIGSGAPDSTSVREEFLLLLNEVAAHLGLRSWNDIQEVLCTFFWVADWDRLVHSFQPDLCF